MIKKGLCAIVLLVICLSVYGQNSVPLFLRDRSFDITYEYNKGQKEFVVGTYRTSGEELNFNENTFYLKRDSITINTRMQYEYFKMDGDVWLEVKTINKESTLRYYKVLEEIIENDTMMWFGAKYYDSGFHVIQYNELDTLSNQVIQKND